MIALLRLSPMRQAGGQRHQRKKAEADHEWGSLPVRCQCDDESEDDAENQDTSDGWKIVLVGYEYAAEAAAQLAHAQAFFADEDKAQRNGEQDDGASAKCDEERLIL